MQDDVGISQAAAAERAKWARAGVEIEERQMTPETLAISLKKVLTHTQSLRGRYVPSSFSPSDSSLTIFPRAESWRWDSIERTLADHEGRGLMVRLPLFWQVEIPLFSACNKQGLFIFVNDKGNMPLGAMAILRSSVAVVVTDAADANEFATFLMVNGLSFPDTWHIVQKSDSMVPLVPALTNSARTLVQEIHLIPGVPVLEQCAHIAGKEFSFHVGAGYTWEHGTNALVTGHIDDPLPLIRYETSLTTDEVGLCVCGKTIVRAQNAQRSPTTAS